MNSFDSAIQSSVNFQTTETVSENYGSVGDILTYTLSITNNGDADALNLIVTDLVPQGANFIANSVKVNGATISGVDPALGISIGTIPISATSTIVLKAQIVTLPWSGSLINYGQLDYQYVDATTTPSTITASIDSNSVVTTVNAAVISLDKIADTSALTGPGQIIKYSVRLSNIGNVTADSVVFFDTIPQGTSFVSGSVTIGGTSEPTFTVVPPGGLTLTNFPTSSFVTVTFNVTVNTIPASGNITNQAASSYTYVVNPITSTNGSGSSLSNSISISTVKADLSGITKSVNKAYATTNDILTYTITIPNSGNTTAVNVIITDTIPNGTTFIPNTVIVNGVSTSFLPTSINVGTIAVSAIATVQFQVSVN